MRALRRRVAVSTLCALLAGTGAALAAVSAQEAEQLKTTLTPLGGERAGNKDGTIPAWTGGNTTPIPGFKNGGRRPDPFANEKPLFSITAKNMDQYADKLADGTKAMLKKYPNTYRLDVYATHRTAAAPQWVYDNTFKNATRAKIVGPANEPRPEGAFGGIPFPIPKTGPEVIWNMNLRWRNEAVHYTGRGYLGTADGKRVLMSTARYEQQMPYYFKEGSLEKWNGEYWLIRLIMDGPPIRAGEALLGRSNIDPNKRFSFTYLTGQRRVRRLPNACCDTPNPGTGGVMGFDDIEVLTAGVMDRFDWKLLGKKEVYIPYNSNRSEQPTKDFDLLGERHLNPDYVRWELHRVWVVEATLAKGQRHQVHRSLYYIDEDSWFAVLGDRWDGAGRLWKNNWALVETAPDIPGILGQTFGFYDLVSNSWYAAGVVNEQSEQYKLVPRYPDRLFTPEALAGEGVR